MPGTVGQPFAINLFLSGGAAPYTWAVSAGQLPADLHLQTFSDPRDANDELTGTPTTADTLSWTMRVTGVYGTRPASSAGYHPGLTTIRVAARRLTGGWRTGGNSRSEPRLLSMHA
ncbi:MAG: putative Ig domain-containing protein [Streptosporangiaceae bacterium]